MAQVVEPNGLSVPVAPAASGERSVQAYFEGLNPPEPIDAVADASAEPSTLSPLCGFEAELVMSESQSPAGLAWYNVPADETAAPAALYPVLAETTASGARISSSAIRGNPHYEGGLVGFALTKFGGQPIYYSEAARNFLCSACVSPGHWKLIAGLSVAARGRPRITWRGRTGRVQTRAPGQTTATSTTRSVPLECSDRAVLLLLALESGTARVIDFLEK